MKNSLNKISKITPALLLIGCIVGVMPLRASELMSITGTPAKEGDIINARLGDLHPTQPVVGFDEIYYKLGRFVKDRRKIFREYCKHNGQLELVDISEKSNLQDPSSFTCQQPIGMSRDDLKSVVIAPNGELYLINGHHSTIEFYAVDGGGPDVRMNYEVEHDYRWLKSMDDFWKKMQADQNLWLYDGDGKTITVDKLPKTFAMKDFYDDPYRSLLYFTRKIAWNSPERFMIPDSDESYPAIPFVEFYWSREIRQTVDLHKYDLSKHDDYIAAIRAVGNVIINVKSNNIGGSGKGIEEVGKFRFFNERELARIDRPVTGKLCYMLEYKAGVMAEMRKNNRDKVALQFQENPIQN